ncbi:MAG TPA: hypothetical protein VLJ10_00925 [Candidatus Bathyarchaeia archaeon]|nr:hypothetical protein [Candidatus Bathyarchaeia archaeon]
MSRDIFFRICLGVFLFYMVLTVVTVYALYQPFFRVAQLGGA